MILYESRLLPSSTSPDLLVMSRLVALVNLLETLDETTLFQESSDHKKKHAETSTDLDRSQAADKEEDKAGPASHRTREKLNMRQNVLDISGSTLVRCTNHDEGCNRRFASSSNARRKKKELCK